MKARLSIEVEGGVTVSPDGIMQFETPGLSEDLRLLRNVIKAQRDGVELFPGQSAVAPLLAGLFDKPLQVFVVGEVKTTTIQEFTKFELAKPAEGVAAAVAAIRALNRDL